MLASFDGTPVEIGQALEVTPKEANSPARNGIDAKPEGVATGIAARDAVSWP